MNILHKYAIREHVAPFFFSFSVIMFVLILKFMLQMMDMLISKGAGIVIVTQLIVYNLAWMVALVVPMSVLVASVMAFGRMGADNEVIAMKASGVSMYRLISPVLLVAVALTIVMVWFNRVILPEANRRASSLRGAIAYKKPALLIKNREGRFVTSRDIPFTFKVDELDPVTDELRSIMLFRHQNNEETIIIADRGRFFPAVDHLTLVLKDGEIHRRDTDEPERYVRSSFAQFTYVVKGISFGLDTSYQAAPNDRTMTVAAMKGIVGDNERTIQSFEATRAALPPDSPTTEMKNAQIDEHISFLRRDNSKYLVEVYKKDSIPVAAIIFALIGAALGMLVRRSGASIGIGMSIGFFMLYYLFLIGGESAADRLLMPPWLAMWAPNIVLGLAGCVLFVVAARK